MAQSTFLILGASSFYGKAFAKCVESHGGSVVLPKPLWRLGGEIPQADYIVNFASRSLVAESWEDPVGWMSVNAALTADLFERARQQTGLRKFVHVSTPEVYGDMEGWQAENWNFNPSTPYAVSRAAADMLLKAYHKAYRFPAVITRTANIYGVGQTENRIVPLAFKTFREGGNLMLHGGGSTKRAFVHVSDAAEATYQVALNGTPGQSYHISSEKVVSILELCHMILKLVGKGGIGSQPERLGKDLSYMLDSKTMRNMGWREKYTLERGLQEYAERTESPSPVPAQS